MTTAEHGTEPLDVAARIRAARARERALRGVPAAVRSPAALRDRLLAALASSDGLRPTGDRVLTAVGVRYPRVGARLRATASRALVTFDAVAWRTRRDARSARR